MNVIRMKRIEATTPRRKHAHKMAGIIGLKDTHLTQLWKTFKSKINC